MLRQEQPRLNFSQLGFNVVVVVCVVVVVERFNVVIVIVDVFVFVVTGIVVIIVGDVVIIVGDVVIVSGSFAVDEDEVSVVVVKVIISVGVIESFVEKNALGAVVIILIAVVVAVT